MNPLIRTCLLALLCIAVSNRLPANDGRMSPFNYNNSCFKASVKQFDAMTNVPASAKVCACRILNLQRNNKRLENMVVLAEKTRSGKRDFYIARNRVIKETRYLKFLFFNEVEVVDGTVAATDCQTLYARLKTERADLKLFEVLDADLRIP